MHTCTHEYIYKYPWFKFHSPDPLSRHLGIHQLSFYSHPNSFRIPVAHQQQAVLVDCQTKYLICPRQETKVRLWESDSWQFHVTQEHAWLELHHFSGRILQRQSFLQLRCSEMPYFHLFLKPATLLFSLWTLWPASDSFPTHYFYTGWGWFSEKIKLLKIIQIKKMVILRFTFLLVWSQIYDQINIFTILLLTIIFQMKFVKAQ